MIATLNSDPRLLAYLPLNGNTADHSARHNIGTNNNILFGSDGFNSFGRFNGTSSYIQIANPTSFNFGTADYSISFWVYPTSIGSTWYCLFSKAATTGWATSSKQITLEASGVFQFDAYNVGSCSGVTVAKQNKWHHVVFTFLDSPNTASLYVNGKLDKVATLNLGADNAAHVVRAGWRGDGGYFVGNLRDYRIYNKALRAEEVLRLYNQGLSKSTNRLGFLNTISAVIEDINSFFHGW